MHIADNPFHGNGVWVDYPSSKIRSSTSASIVTHLPRHLSLTVKVSLKQTLCSNYCASSKNGNFYKVRVVCITMYQCVCWGKERAYIHAVCNRTLSCNDVLNALLHTAQVYVSVHLTNKKNLTSNPQLLMDCHQSNIYSQLCIHNPFHGNRV